MHVFQRRRLLLVLSGLVLAVCVHWWNAEMSDLPFGLHATADDPSYLRPAENFFDHGTWKDNSTGASSFVQRPPLFGSIHLVFYSLFGSSAAVAGMIFFFLLHGLALYQLPALLKNFTSERRSLLFAALYALLPCFWGFLSYQITEALSASLVLLLLAAVLHKGNYSLAVSLLLFLCCWLLRPVLILLFPLLLYRLIRERKTFISLKHWWTPAALLIVVATSFLWEYRKAGYMEHWGELHPIYHPTNESLFRPVHASLTDLFRVWETRPEVFHAIAGSSESSDTNYRSRGFVQHYITERKVPLKPEILYALLQEYARVNRALQQRFPSERIVSESSGEIVLRQKIDRLADSLRKAEPLQYHILTPLKGMREQLPKSQLNLELFQLHYRGSWWAEALRFICVIVILGSLFLTFLALFSRNRQLILLAAGAFLYLFYLFYFQRLNEDRYLLPVLPVLLIVACGRLQDGKTLDS